MTNNLSKIVERGEDWLMARTLGYALERGYTKDTSTQKEDWRLSIHGLSEALISAIPGGLAGLEFGPEDAFTGDPASAFAVTEARRHRAGGVSLAVFLGLLQCLRQSCLDLFAAADLDSEASTQASMIVERFFDRIVVGVAAEWCAPSKTDNSVKQGRKDRQMTDKQQGSLSLFEFLDAPTAFIDSDGIVRDHNPAAAAWLEWEARARTAGSAGATPQSAGVNGRPASEVFPWIVEPLRQMQEGDQSHAYASLRLGQGEDARDIIARLSRSTDFSRNLLGIILVIQDVTELKRIQEDLDRSNQRLEAEVQARTRSLEQANERLEREVRDREMYQQALAESAALYRAVAEDQGEIICRFRPDGSLVFANSAYARTFGSILMVNSDKVGPVLAEGQAVSLDQVLERIRPGQAAVSFEQSALMPSGQHAWYRWTCRGIFDRSGEVAAYQFVGQEITREREAEQSLHTLNASLEQTVRERTEELEARARSFESLNRNLQLQIQSRRKAEEALAKAVEEQQAKVRQITALYDLSDTLGASWDSVEQMLDLASNALLRGWRLAEGVTAAIEFDDREYRSEGFGPDQSCIHTPLSVFGHERGQLSVCRPVADGTVAEPFHTDETVLLHSMAHQLERALESALTHDWLARSEREYREFFDNAAEAIFIHDASGTILDANKKAALWFNMTADELVGAQLADLAVEADREALVGRFLNALREEPELFRITLYRKDGFAIPLEMLCQAQGYQGLTAVFSSCRNISRRLQSEAEAARRMDQEQLLARISSRLVNAIGAEVAEAMREALGAISGFVGVQRAMVYQFEKPGGYFALKHQWQSPESLPLDPSMRRLGRIKSPWLFERSMTQEWIAVRDVGHLPPAAAREREMLGRAGISGFTAIPMVIRGSLHGLFVVATSTRDDRVQPDPQVLLQLAPLFSNVLLRQASRRALFESAELTRSILNALPSYLCVLDRHGGIIMTNRAWQVSGAKTGPAVAAAHKSRGVNYLAFLDDLAAEGDAQAAPLREGIAAVLAGQSPLLRIEFSSRSGPVVRWFLLEATPVRGGASGAVLSHLDITARKRAERRLAKNETRYRTLTEALHEGLLMIRNENVMAYINTRFADMLGHTKASMLGRRPEEYAAPESTARLAELLSGRWHGAHAQEIVWNHSSGRHVYTLVSPSAAYGDEGELIGVYAVITDTTERKELESQLLQSQKLEAIGQLAAGIAHEINTPAQYVGNNIRFLKGAFEDMLGICGKARELCRTDREAAPPTGEELAGLRESIAAGDLEYLETEVPGAINQTIEGVERISTIVRSVKQFAHPGAAIMAPADLNEAMQSTVTVSRNEWKYVADLEMDLDGSLLPVICMIGEINQVVLNLIVNAAHAIADAIKADPERKGRITLSTRHTPPWAEIRVSDTGTGIPPEVQGKIFDPFFTTKEVGKGTGQGLTIAHSIVVDKHHGQLFFETEPGRGTTFVVRLPMEQQTEVEA